MARRLLLYDSAISGNAYKVRLCAAQLGLSLERVQLDLLKGEALAPEFKARNPFGRVPFLLDDDFALAESNAILCHLARGTPLFPAEPRRQSLVLQWMFFEQNQVEMGLAVARYYMKFRPDHPKAGAIVEQSRPRGIAALKTIEAHLDGGRRFLVGDYTVADIALFAYAHLAEEAGVPLADFPRVRDWIGAVQATPGFVAMEAP